MRIYILLSLFYLSLLSTDSVLIEEQSVKCLIQLKNYSGEGAYIAVSIIDDSSNYIEILQLRGYDDEWYPELFSWHSFYEQSNHSEIDAITGATISGGGRAVFVLDLDDEWIDANYSIRFETSVEDQEYFEKDLEFNLTSTSLSESHSGTGYIRYVRFIKN